MRRLLFFGCLLLLVVLVAYPFVPVAQISGGGIPSTVGQGGGHTIKDEGTARPDRTNLNFVGGGVDVTDTAGSDETTVTITGVGTGLPDPTGTGIVVKDSATPTTVSRTITGTANQITVTNGSGVSGNPTLSIPSSPTLPGTTSGTFSGPLTGNVTGNVTGALTGNADTATSFSVNPANCTVAGTFGPGITAAGVAENCVALSAVNAQTTTYQVLAADFDSYKTITVASGTFNITLIASGAQPAAGKYIDIVNYGSGIVTILRSGQNINGGISNLILPAGSATDPSSARIISDGTNYFADVQPSLAGASAATATLTNKTIDLTDNTVTGTLAELNTAISDANVVPETRTVNGHALSGDVTVTKGDVGLGNVDNTSNVTERAATATLTNKTIDLTDNTVTGTLAEFNTAISDANVPDAATTLTVAGTANEITSSAGAQDLTANRTWTLSLPSSIDLGGKALEAPNGTARPGTCTVGQVFFDSDEVAGQNWYGCTATNTWTLLGGTGGGDAQTANPLSQFAATTSAQLAGVISNETGSGALVFGTSPAITTPTGIVKGDVGLGNVDNTSDATKNAATATLTNKTIDLTSNTLVGSVAEFNAALEAADFATLAGTETLTGKTLDLTSNTLVGSVAEFNAALESADFATLAGTETLTGKTVSLSNNTVVGTIAQFNTAVSDADLATLAGTETLTGKTLDLASNTLTGTLAQFNTAISDGNLVPEARTVTVAGTANEITSSAGAQDLSANRTWTLSLASSLDLGGKALEIPNSITLPATCTVGQIYMDTDATSGQRLYACQATDTWVVQGDGGSGGLTDGDKGDITVSSSASVLTIDNDVVTYAKMQNVSASDRVLCRDTAAAGNMEECVLDDSLEFTGGPGIQRAALTGDVTAAAGGNATTIANDAVTNAKMANMATATIKGRNTAGTGDPEDLSAATAKTLLGLNLVDNTSDATKNAAAVTLTNKRITPRVSDVADASPIAVNSDSFDSVTVSELSQNTTFSIPTGTPTDDQFLSYSICTTVSRTLTFTTGTNGFSADYGIPLPVASPTASCMLVGFRWNIDIDKWVIVASTQGIGGGTGQKNLPVTGIKMASSNSAVLDRSETNDRLLFDTSTRWCATWQFVAPNDYNSSPALRLQYSLSNVTSGTSVHFDATIMAVTPGDAADINSPSPGTNNDCNDTSIPGTAGYLDVITCTLTNNDSLAANDYMKIELCRDVANDNASGSVELVGAAFEYTKQ